VKGEVFFRKGKKHEEQVLFQGNLVGEPFGLPGAPPPTRKGDYDEGDKRGLLWGGTTWEVN